MLTQALCSMVRDGLVLQRDHAEVPPKVDHTLTESGNSLRDCVMKLNDWGLEHHEHILAARNSTI